MWNQSHLSEQFADVISELPPSAEGGIVTVTKSLPLILEWDHCLQCLSQPLPQLLNSKIIKLCKVGKKPSCWHKQENIFSIPLGKPNELMLVLGWPYSEEHGGFEMVPLMMTLSLYIGVLHMISRVDSALLSVALGLFFICFWNYLLYFIFLSSFPEFFSLCFYTNCSGFCTY